MHSDAGRKVGPNGRASNQYGHGVVPADDWGIPHLVAGLPNVINGINPSTPFQADTLTFSSDAISSSGMGPSSKVRVSFVDAVVVGSFGL